jgi:PAS domain S-box-containing protein
MFRRERPRMHPFASIPLLSAVAASALAAAIAARAPQQRPNQLTAALLVTATLWSVTQLLWCTAGPEAAALRWARCGTAVSLLMAPLGLETLRALQPALREPLRRWSAVGWALSLSAAGAAASTGLCIAGVRAAPWGWTPVAAPGAWIAMAASCVAPAVAGVAWWRRAGPVSTPDLPRNACVEWAVAATFTVCVLAELLAPALRLPLPRLAGAPVAAWGAATFWGVYRVRAPIFDPRSFAREILETLPVGVLLVRLDGRIRFTNRVVGELSGFAPRELIGMPLEQLLCDAPESPAFAEDERAQDLHRRDGELVPVSVSETDLRDDLGDQLGSILLVRDQREVVSLRGRLVTSARLAAVGQLAAGIAHEINNPISYVRSNLALLERHWDALAAGAAEAAPDAAVERALDEGPELIHECLEGAERVVSIVRDVGGFSRSGGVTLQTADVAELLDAAVRVAAPQLRPRAAIERHYGQAPLVACLPQELMQVFLNLLLNACQALGERGTIRLYAERHGDRVEVRVEDDGCGIAPADVERVFDPFFTTKPVGQGTGLGLAISRQIVEKHGGTIDVHSEIGRGTSFRVRLPAQAAAGALA